MTQRRFNTLGSTMLKIAEKILSNYELCKMLKYSDVRSTAACPIFEPVELMDKNIILKPSVPFEETKETFLVILLEGFFINNSNYDYKVLSIRFDILVPFNDWGKVDNNLKPFAIMSELDEMFNNKKLNGLGNLTFESAELITVNDELGGYRLCYKVDEFN